MTDFLLESVCSRLLKPSRDPQLVLTAGASPQFRQGHGGFCRWRISLAAPSSFYGRLQFPAGSEYSCWRPSECFHVFHVFSDNEQALSSIHVVSPQV